MPIKKRCRGCGKSITNGAKRNAYCSKCEDKVFASNRKKKTEQYDHRWRKTSELFRNCYPFCVMCFIEHGVLHPAELADHIVPLSDDMVGYPYADPNCFENLAPLCRKHHAQKTIQVDRAFFKGDYEPLKAYKLKVEGAKGAFDEKAVHV